MHNVATLSIFREINLLLHVHAAKVARKLIQSLPASVSKQFVFPLSYYCLWIAPAEKLKCDSLTNPTIL